MDCHPHALDLAWSLNSWGAWKLAGGASRSCSGKVGFGRKGHSGHLWRQQNKIEETWITYEHMITWHIWTSSWTSFWYILIFGSRIRTYMDIILIFGDQQSTYINIPNCPGCCTEPSQHYGLRKHQRDSDGHWALAKSAPMGEQNGKIGCDWITGLPFHTISKIHQRANAFDRIIMDNLFEELNKMRRLRARHIF